MQLSKQFETGLTQLDMLDKQAPCASGLVFLKPGHETPINPYERIALEKAKKYAVDAIYFRRFEDGRPPVPQVYLYDFTQKTATAEEMTEIHRRLWNAGQVVLFMIFTPSEIKIFNCLQKPGIKKRKDTSIINTHPLETIQLAAEIEDEIEKKKFSEFSARKFDNGSFWDTTKHRKEFTLGGGSYETLLDHLKGIHKKIIKQNILEKSLVQKLLVMSILVKYLEERVDENGKHVFPEHYFSRFAKDAKTFTGVLKKKGACLELFDDLGRHFNGEIFKWEKEEERKKISETDLTSFAGFLEARADMGGQGTLWRLYSFNDLPIELISNVYEEFLENKEGIVYTPPYLVHFLIDEAMPLEAPREDFKVLDPACGSGVFLVTAYQRVIDWWRIQNNWQRPGLGTLKRLLRDNIFGIDISPEAVRLAIFSLSLVLMDELSPTEIWDNLKFDNLKELGNLHEDDFFEIVLRKELEEKFDLVIGNPPFQQKFTTSAARAIGCNRKKGQVKLPKNQLALLFQEQTPAVCKSGGLTCLILPAGPILYNYGSVEFRKYFLEKYNVKQILDFTPLREVMFGKRANAEAAALFAIKEEPTKDGILHITFRKTKLSKEKIYFQLDHYDFHRVDYNDALEKPFVWKTNLMGGGRLHHLVSLLSEPKHRTFGEYIKKNEEKNGWKAGKGYIRGKEEKIKRFNELQSKETVLSTKEMEELEKLQDYFTKADHLTGKRELPFDALTENGIDEAKIFVIEDEYFHRPREESIYKGPHVLIKEGAKSSIPIAFRDDALCFKDSIIGIHAPEKYRDELLNIEKRIKGDRVAPFFAIVSSGKHMIKRGTTLQKKDIEHIPYPENPDEIKIYELERILVDDVLDYMVDFRDNGENAKVMQLVTGEQLDRFGEVYCSVLNSVYQKFKPLQPITTDTFVCFPVCYGDTPQVETGAPEHLEQYLQGLLLKNSGRNLRTTRILRLYDRNVIFLVKPRLLRYWLRSIAIRDADETFGDLIAQGY